MLVELMNSSFCTCILFIVVDEEFDTRPYAMVIPVKKKVTAIPVKGREGP
jgi:hypothetical protein